MRLGTVLASMLTALLPPGAVASQEAPAQSAPARPSIVISGLSALRPYVVGTEYVTVIGSLRNGGTGDAPADSVLFRMHALSGLEYADGDPRPQVPALAAGTSARFQCRLMPRSTEAPLVISAALGAAGALPEIRVVALQHFASEPAYTALPLAVAPAARAGDGAAVLQNDRVRLNIHSSSSGVPGAFIFSRRQDGWKPVGVALPIAEAMSSEGGQEPWWEVFRAEEMRSGASPGAASLTLDGVFGVRWRARITMTLRTGSSMVDMAMRLTPRRAMQLRGIRGPRFLVGSPALGVPAPADRLDLRPPLATQTVRWQDSSVSIVWETPAAVADWAISGLGSDPSEAYCVTGIEGRGVAPVPLSPGGSLAIRWRLYVVGPKPPPVVVPKPSRRAHLRRRGHRSAPHPRVRRARHRRVSDD